MNGADDRYKATGGESRKASRPSRFADPLLRGGGGDDDPRLVCREGNVRMRVGPGAFSYRLIDGDLATARMRRGDVLIVEPRPAVGGDWVLALVEGENRVLRYVAERGRAWIEDPAEAHRRFAARDLVIQGVVIALIRRFPLP